MVRRQVLAGALFFAAISLLSLAGAYAMWLSHFFSTPFAQVTFDMLLRSVASAVLAIFGIEFLASLAIVALSTGEQSALAVSRHSGMIAFAESGHSGGLRGQG